MRFGLRLTTVAALLVATSAVADDGAYAVGFTSFVLADPSRAAPPFLGRPIAVAVYYPVEQADVGDARPAAYPVDPVAAPEFCVSAEDVAREGYVPAFQEARPSKRGPFPLRVYSPPPGGWLLDSAFLGPQVASRGEVLVAIEHHADAEDAAAAAQRKGDVAFVLGELLARNGMEGDLLEGVVQPRLVEAWANDDAAADAACAELRVFREAGSLAASEATRLLVENGCEAAEPEALSEE